MAAPSGLVTEPTASQQPQEVFQWLKNLPLAPEYHPTLAEFQDPIAYIFKIEKEASKYGICKIVPPVLAAPKKAAIANLNRSLAARSSSSKSAPTFTTRQQQIGFCPRKPRPVQKPVWQSGENYTFQEFEAKAKSFEKSYFKKCPKKTAFSPLEVETLYWKATVDKPFSVEYANDMPGSAFSVKKMSGGKEIIEGVTVGETEWNMRGVSRAKGSLLRFMKEEIPGVTSPMVYVAMMFSWFAWHVEDHDLHSLNYLHLGAGKTWYGVPKEAAVAFEEVVRDHGYGGEINPLVTFSVLGEKTTVMSPEVFVTAGVPCCRLVQNAGEFVVTFPRAYHSGFSHGFNCGEAANIATPEWLRVAKDAAIRRASINYPPMVSHFQLLYDLALELCTRMPVSISAKPRSSRLKDKQKGEGETLVKEQFVQNVIHNNELLHILGKGSSVVLLPRSSSDISVCSDLRVGSQLRVNPSLGLCTNKGIMKSSKSLVPDETMPERNYGIDQSKGTISVKEKFASLCERNRFSSLNGNENKHTTNTRTENKGTTHGDKLSDQRLFSCVTCGILSFDCIAVVQPTETAARYLMSADCSFFNDWIVGSGATNNRLTTTNGDPNTCQLDQPTGWVENSVVDHLYDVPVQSVNYQPQKIDKSKVNSNATMQGESSALGLLALNYGNSSDSEEDQDEPDVSDHAIDMPTCSSENKYKYQNCALPSFKQECHHDETVSHTLSLVTLDCGDKVSLQTDDCHKEHGDRAGNFKDGTPDCFLDFGTDNMEPNGSECRFGDAVSISHINSNCSPAVHDTEKMKFRRVVPRGNGDMPFAQRSDEDSSRMHVFCLEHAVEVEQQFRSIGGVHILLLCHPEYPRLEAEAKLVSEELGIDHLWNDIAFRDATKNDEENIQSALDSEEAIPGNGDWAVKLGINLFYSASLSHSSLYSKQMPYNSVIYKAFGRVSPASSPTKLNVYGRRSGKQKKVVAGRWCGKVWMSNQVHNFLLKNASEDRDQEEEQDGSFHGWKMLDEKVERKLQNFYKTETALAAAKSVRKRKLTTVTRPIKKVKSPETEAAASDDLEEDVSHKQHTKVYSRKQTKHIEREVSYDSLDNSHQQHGKTHRIKQAKSVERDDAVSDDSLGGNTHQQQHRRILRSKQVKYIDSENDVSDTLIGSNSQKQHSRIPKPRSKQVKYIRRKSEISDDSLEGDINEWHGRGPRSTQAGFYGREVAVSDDSLEESSHRPLGTVRRSKQAAYFESEDALSDDSVENSSLQQNRRVSRGSLAKYFEREDEVSDDMLEENTFQQCTGSHRSRKKKFVDREGEVSDNLLDESTQLQHRRIFRSKQGRFVEREDEVSDDSLEDNSQQQRRIPTSKRAKFVESEDAVSDELEDDTHLKHWRIPRSKKAKIMEREACSDDLQENDAQWQPRKTPRGKPVKFIEREDVSDDLEEATHWQQRKTSRHKPVTSFEREDVSDDLQEENTRWQPRKTTRGKQTKFFEKEDVSDDLQEDDTRWHPSKTPKSKQAKYAELEDAVSDDLLEDNSTKQHRRILRNKQKSGTLGKVNRESIQHVKQGTARAKKKENSKSIKKEKEVKQENPGFRNSKSGRLFESHVEEEVEGGPSTRLRKRPSKASKESETKLKEKLQSNKKKVRGSASAVKRASGQKNNKDEDAEYQCDIEGCTMSFGSKQELAVHKRNICPVKGCGKTFLSHKYLVQHRRVHLDDRPLKCPWKGCKVTFKWAWARTEHIRVHTGARPYVCAEEGCGQTFRFVSDFSRHKRKTGHSVKKSRN
ncbi:lysine-specific demethylase REF6 [Ricinus communis]|uniref:lysine-specific demethylase REF6 n=1 Tax=Ricinus communis TaxID=3988 RepID=UPI00201AAE0C|nr:lysine-specific demethylase REF6 [Ricinus communis]